MSTSTRAPNPEPKHTVLIASNNAHKLQELTEIVALAGADGAIHLITPCDLGLSLDPDETADTYLGNAQIKARAFAQALRTTPVRGATGRGPVQIAPDELVVMADDSGLEVDALGGRPGLRSARYSKAAPGGDGCAALLAELSHVPEANRTARFRCVIVLAWPGRGLEQAAEGVCEGAIGWEKRGLGGFGFDPVFVPVAQPVGQSRHLAELAASEKHRISHRGIAVRKALAQLLQVD